MAGTLQLHSYIHLRTNGSGHRQQTAAGCWLTVTLPVLFYTLVNVDCCIVVLLRLKYRITVCVIQRVIAEFYHCNTMSSTTALCEEEYEVVIDREAEVWY